MGGTFDPIHYGHLVTAAAAHDAYDLDLVIFVPAARPPHKDEQQVTAANHRYLMAVLATLSNPHFTVSGVELDRPGPSYTADTMRYFRHLYSEEAELFFITGADAIVEIRNWRNTEGLLDMCRFIAATRPGFPVAKLRAFIASLPAHQAERISALDVPALAISSTDLRARVKAGRTIKYLLPESVENYITRNGLYGPRAGSEQDRARELHSV